MKAKERYDYSKWYVDIFADELPKKSSKTIFLGLLAETEYKVYLDINELSKHVIIAGATGKGKTIAAQVIAEGVLMKNIPVIVIDPTDQWSGFKEKLDDEKMLSLFPKFGLPRARQFKTEIIFPGKFSFKNLHSGKIFVVAARNASSKLEELIVSVLDKLGREKFTTKGLSCLLVFEEFHRILKPDLLSKDLLQRFSKLGIGVMLVSQLLSDFTPEIRSMVSTHIQLKTTSSRDLRVISTKYGNRVKSLATSETGIGLFYNPSFNNGNSVFVNFRPILHKQKGII
jgi:DNA helicase HerA-like ATPase